MFFQIIFCREYTRAGDQNYHLPHFCCLRCDTQLAGQSYMAKEGNPYCLTCYGQIYPISCEVGVCTFYLFSVTSLNFISIQTCKGSISVDEPRLSHDGKFWHSRDACFKCFECEKSLMDQPFLPKFGKIFCRKECMRTFKKQIK